MRKIQNILQSGSSIALGGALLAAMGATSAHAAGNSDAEASDPVIDVSVTSQALLGIAQQAATEVVDEVEDSGNVLIVTGTRRSNRTVSESPVPIDVISDEQIRQSGLTETARVLRDLVPSLNFPQPSITDGTDAIRPATLRGLGPDQTLVLINGKRRHVAALLNLNGSVGRGSTAVDLNQIPASSIGRVEVLRDGAAAQYGSDAIAGVINFQLNDSHEGGRFFVNYGGFNTRIDGVQEITGVNGTAGQTPTLTPDGQLQLTGTGRDLKVTDGEVLTVSGNIGLPLGAEGFVNITAEYRDRNDTNRAGYDPRRNYSQSGALDPRELTLDRRYHRYGDPKTEDLNIVVNMGMPLDDQVSFYAFGTYGTREAESAGFYRRAADNRNVLAIYPDGFLPLINTDTKDLAIVGGLEGDFGGWNWDLSMSYGENETEFFITDTLNASLGAASPTEFDAGAIAYSQLIANLGISRDIEVSGIEELTLSFGTEWRREEYQLTAGEPDSYRAGPVRVGTNNSFITGSGATAFAAPGAQVFPGFQPVIGGVNVTTPNSRENVSLYAELDADLTSGWNVQVAGRFEDYSDFGSTLNGKLASRLELVDGFALRGALSTGFRAPSLQQQFFAAAATNNIGGVLVDAVTLPVNNPVAVALGASPLKAEKSFSWSAGAVFDRIDGLNITFDYYQIDIDDRIVLTDNLTANRDAAGAPTGTNPGRGIAQILNDAGFTSISAARFFFNGIDTRTRGFDAIATYRTGLGDLGTLSLTAGYNRNDIDITGRRSTPGDLAQVPGIDLFGRLESLRIERGQPKDRINLGADWEWGWLSTTLRTNRFGEVFSAGATPINDVLLAPRWVTDLEFRIRPEGTFADGVELAFGANNLFDVYPTTNPVGRATDPVTNQPGNLSVNNYFLPFSSFSPFGFNGRFLYGRISFAF
ncbi:TonB-dependent receptor plug domain-containing protein [Porphyrobacter sp. ULC335]|uniref:TonB-dependent receptor plug domain-containing protein n=1 Tax=Porphyrobacter sp. ULC335 TaxID=2854260 RepID=UPI00221E7562|nr:TonB-dependent receptor [Porphyrobacter sp. ULC335]UYV16904.1 TonB-dependent receptor [Porphyrobacter sp. ULC335]